MIIMIVHLCRTLAAALALVVFAVTSVAAQPEFSQEDITHLVLPAQNPSDGPHTSGAVALIGDFHEADRYWWDEATGWGFPDAPEDMLADAVADAEAFLSGLRDEAMTAGLDEELATDMRLYPVEAMTQWLCVVREGCYPKGVMVGTGVIDEDAAVALCEGLSAMDQRCRVVMVP